MNRIIPVIFLFALVVFVLYAAIKPENHKQEDIESAQHFMAKARFQEVIVRKDIALQREYTEQAQFYCDQAEAEK